VSAKPTRRATAGLLAVTVAGVLAAPVVHPSAASAAANYAEQQGHHGANTFTNYHNASGMGPRVDPAAWVQVSCKVYDPFIASVNPDGYWYRLSGGPWNDQYYAAANTFMNGDPWNGPYTHNTDFNVPDCGAVPPLPPPPSPTVNLAQGPTATVGYRYAITLAGFGAGQAVSISCRDSVNPGGFYTFSLTTNSSGQAFTQGYCYSNDGPDHWAVANGIASNHVAWGATAGGGGGTPTPPGGGTGGGDTGTQPPGSPRRDPRPTGGISYPQFPRTDLVLAKQPPPSFPTRLLYQGDLIEIQTLAKFCLSLRFYNCYNDIQHYVDATGTERTVPMAQLFSYLSGLREKFQSWLRDYVAKSIATLRKTAPTEAVVVRFDTAGTTQNWSRYKVVSNASDWRWALGRFSIRMVGNVWIGPADESGRRTVQVQYRSFMFDVYDFGDEFANLENLATHGMAAEFLETGESRTITTAADLTALNPATLDLEW
jgi:hypothetical protein